MGKKRKEKEGDKDREETEERETPSKKSKIEEDKVEEEGGRSVSRRGEPLCEIQHNEQSSIKKKRPCSHKVPNV